MRAWRQGFNPNPQRATGRTPSHPPNFHDVQHVTTVNSGSGLFCSGGKEAPTLPLKDAGIHRKVNRPYRRAEAQTHQWLQTSEPGLRCCLQPPGRPTPPYPILSLPGLPVHRDVQHIAWAHHRLIAHHILEIRELLIVRMIEVNLAEQRENGIGGKAEAPGSLLSTSLPQIPQRNC